MHFLRFIACLLELLIGENCHAARNLSESASTDFHIVDRAGQLVCVLAGPAAAVNQVKKYTKGVMGRADIDFSNQPHGKATLLKIIGNTFVLNMVEQLSEGHTLAVKSGLGNENLHAFIEAMFPGPYVSLRTSHHPWSWDLNGR